MGCVQEAGMNHKGFKKVYSAPGYPIDPKLASERENAVPEQKFVPIFRGTAPKNWERLNKGLLLQVN
jgi:hypothetical protein